MRVANVEIFNCNRRTIDAADLMLFFTAVLGLCSLEENCAHSKKRGGMNDAIVSGDGKKEV